MCCGFTKISLVNSPSNRFHKGRQYCPVDSMAISVTWQFFSHARNCFRSRVNVGNLRFLTAICDCPMGGNTHTITLSLWTSMPQQRRCFSFTSAPSTPSEGRLESKDIPTRVHTPDGADNNSGFQ